MQLEERTFNEIVTALRLADKERDWNDRRAYPRVPMQKCMAIIPYRGAAPALQDVIAGQTDLMVDVLSNSLPHIQSGKIRPFAVTAAARVASASDIPTVDEAGLPGLYIAVWHGLWAPKGTPKDVAAKLTAAIMEALADPEVREKFAGLGQDIPEPAQQTPESLRAYHEAEIKLWWPLIKAAGIKIE